MAEIVAVRDSTDPHGPALVFTKYEWTIFLRAAADGDVNQDE